jgi:sulfur carrier protein
MLNHVQRRWQARGNKTNVAPRAVGGSTFGNACIRNKAIANIRQHRGNPRPPMQLRIFVNGEATETDAATLAELVAQCGFPERGVATALNGEFVPRDARKSTLLVGDDEVEIVSPRQGG